MNEYNNRQMSYETSDCTRRMTQPRQYGDMRMPQQQHQQQHQQQYTDMAMPRQGTTTMTAGMPPEVLPDLPQELYPTQRGATTPMTRPFSQGAPPVTEINYIPGYLASLIGKNVKAEFVVGSNQYVEKTGMLIDVGVNYFVLLDTNTRTTIMCDLYAVKFVTAVHM